MCKIHTISKSASINWESSLNECLQYLTNAQILYYNLFVQNKLIQPKFWPTNSTTGEWSKIGHEDLFLTSRLKASGRFQTNKRKTARRNCNDPKLSNLLWMTSYMLLLPILYLNF